MKAITTYTILLIKFVRNGIHVSIIRHRLMESRIEYTDLRYVRQNCIDRMNTFQICRIVQRSQIIASSKGIEHFLGQQNRLAELLTAMYHTMANSIDFIQRLDSTILRRDESIQNELYTYRMFWNIFFQNFLFTIR